MGYQFTIIIPVYNVLPYIKECLDSVVTSVIKYGKTVELICVDDGSTDGSGTLLEEYKPKTQFIVFYVLHQKNAGVSVARNRGLEIAKGDYICFVDADDYVMDNWLVDYSEAIDESQSDIVRLGERRGAVEDVNIWLWEKFVEKGMPWMYSIRRDIAICAIFPEGVSYSEDALYAMRLVPFIKSAFEIPKGGYVYRVRPGSASLKKFSSQERLRFIKDLYEIGLAIKNPKPLIFSRACSIQLLLWTMNPKDVEYKNEIRVIYKKMCQLGWPTINSMIPIRWFPYLTYRYTGWLWPSRLWEHLISFGVGVKKKLL